MWNALKEPLRILILVTNGRRSQGDSRTWLQTECYPSLGKNTSRAHPLAEANWTSPWMWHWLSCFLQGLKIKWAESGPIKDILTQLLETILAVILGGPACPPHSSSLRYFIWVLLLPPQPSSPQGSLQLSRFSPYCIHTTVISGLGYWL